MKKIILHFIGFKDLLFISANLLTGNQWNFFFVKNAISRKKLSLNERIFSWFCLLTFYSKHAINDVHVVASVMDPITVLTTVDRSQGRESVTVKIEQGSPALELGFHLFRSCQLSSVEFRSRHWGEDGLWFVPLRRKKSDIRCVCWRMSIWSIWKSRIFLTLNSNIYMGLSFDSLYKWD